MKTSRSLTICVLLCATCLCSYADDGQKQTDENAIPVEEGRSEKLEAIKANITGGQHYRRKDYEIAYPHLKLAAEKGFKVSQARLSQIYLRGLGGVDQDIRSGIGWLGVASAPPSSPQIRKEFRRLRKQFNGELRMQFDRVVDIYRKRYEAKKLGLYCENKSEGSTTISTLVCTYTHGLTLEDQRVLDEIHDRQAFLFEDFFSDEGLGILPEQRVTPRIRGW